MKNYLFLFLTACALSACVGWSNRAFAQQEDKNVAECCAQNRIDACTSDSKDPCCDGGDCASDGSDATKSEKCCQEAGGDALVSSGGQGIDWVCCNGKDVIAATSETGKQFCCQNAGGKAIGEVCCSSDHSDVNSERVCCEDINGIYDDGQMNNVVCCAQSSSKDMIGNYNSRCCTNAGGTSVSNNNGEYCCKSWGTALKGQAGAPMCGKK